MKRSIIVGMSAVALTMTAHAFGADFKSDKDKVSYVIGHQIGSDMQRSGADIDLDSMMKGVKEGLAGTASKLTTEEGQKVMNDFRTSMRTKMEEKRKKEGETNDKAGKEFLAKNAKEKGVKVTASGLQYTVITEGKGVSPKATETVKVQYKGTLLDGKEFDSSYKRGEAATFPVNGVIKGWTEALQLMKPGAKYKLWIPSDLAYGDKGAGPEIGANSTLTFEVELVEIVPPAKDQPKIEGQAQAVPPKKAAGKK